MLSLKPNQHVTVTETTSTNAAELLQQLRDAIAETGQPAETVHVRDCWGNPVLLSLEAESLTDGSIVYNLYVGPHATRN